MNCFVFLGPSLPLARARAHLQAEYLPPVAMGDVYALVRSRARPGDHIALIDGVFEQVPAVWHKEILFALERGVHVHGASSMGALRAAELQAFGMRGVGRIFEAFRDGVLEDDDEVAVVHAPAEAAFRPLSAAMVSIRALLQRLQGQGLLGAEQAARLAELSKQRPYWERSWAELLADARALALGAAVEDAIRSISREDDAKALDAIELLDTLARELAAPARPHAATFALEQTRFWRGLAASQEPRLRSADSGQSPTVKHDALLRDVRALAPDRRELLREALLLRLLSEQAQRQAPPTADELRAAALRLADRKGLAGQAALDAYRAEQELDSGDWRHWLQLEVVAERLIAQSGAGLDGFLLLLLKAEGRLDAGRERVQAQQQRLQELGIERPELADAGIGADALQHWYEASTGNRMLPDPETYAHSLGFSSLRDLLMVLLAAYIGGEGKSAAAAQPASAPGSAETA
ncbi:TfuA-like protein [Aquimonas voraii]|uniref:TfuA-like core domain-containing protein n=1 Tax=Aquimonas voraii TaxID=265719 RepID=A0A1G6Y2E5_9GAMM|nr:TfuA-like protein [Aquimonas voraii]SDD84674.1 hypothetical protein SAMN04488509_108111 [Aquimonas voraii]